MIIKFWSSFFKSLRGFGGRAPKVLLLLLILSACGYDVDDYVEEQVTLQLWLWDETVKGLEITAGFDRPDIDLEIIVIPWADYWQRLQSALFAGDGPDIFWMNHPNAVSYMPSGLLMDLTELGLELSGFEAAQYLPFMYQGRLFGLPMFFDTVALFYNKTLFDEAGIPYPPHRGWTWEEIREAALALTVTSDDEVRQFGLGISHNTQIGTANFIFQAGGHMFSPDRMALDINNSGALTALRFMHGLIHEDRVSPTPSENADINFMGELFVNNMMAMEINGLWRTALYYEFLGEQLGIAHLPRHLREANSFHSLAYAVASHTRHPEAVKAFLEYAASPAHGNIVAPVFLPAHRESRHLWFDNFPSLNLRVFAEAMEIAEPLQIAAVNAGPVWDTLTREMELIFSQHDIITEEILEALNDVVNMMIHSP